MECNDGNMSRTRSHTLTSLIAPPLSGLRSSTTMSLFVVLGVSLLLLKDVSSIPLEQFYPFGSRADDAFLLPNDDGSSPPVQLTSDFPFFDQNFRIIYVCKVAV